MKIGIVGSGKIGATLARLWVDQGHELALANRRGPETLGDLVAELGEHARADSVEGTAQFADLVQFGEIRQDWYKLYHDNAARLVPGLT